MNRQYWSTQKQSMRGFSLIETLISFVVLAVGLLALLSFHSSSQRNISEAKTQAEAVALAEEKLQELESFLAIGDVRLDATPSSPGTCDPSTIAGTLATFTRCWIITETPLVGADGTRKDVRVRVTWADRDNVGLQNPVLQEVIL